MAFNGATSTINGTFRAKVIFDAKVYPIQFKIVDGSKYDAIIGLDFLNRHSTSLEFQKGMLTLDSGEKFQIFKRECDINNPPVLSCSVDREIPPLSKAYLPCSVVGITSSPQAILCLDDTAKFSNDTCMLVAHSVVPSNGQAYVVVLNMTNNSIQVCTGATIGTLVECELIPYSINKFRTNAISAANVEPLTYSLEDVCVKTAELTDSEKSNLKMLLNRFGHVFASDDSLPGRTSLVKHHIDLEHGTRPFKLSDRRIPIHLQAEADKENQKMLDNAIVEPSNSEFSSPPDLVRKKDGSVRFGIGYRKLNEKTIKDSYPLPRISEAIDSIGCDAKFFTTLDLAMGYHHVPVAEKDKHKTAFPSRFGLFQYTAMPFGLTNAPATFQRLMERVLAHMNWRDCLVYIDDVLIWSKTFDEHLRKLEQVFQAFEKAGLRINPPQMPHLLQISSLSWTPAQCKRNSNRSGAYESN